MRDILRYLGNILGRALPALVLLVVLPGLAAAGYIGPDIPIADKNYNQQNPHTIFLPDKNVWFVVWGDERNSTTTGYDIYGQFINGNDGSFCGPEFPIVNVTGNQTVPKASYRPLDDKVLVVWQDTRGDASGGYVYYQPITTVPDELTCAAYTPPAPAAGTAIGFNDTKYWNLTLTPNPSTAALGTGDGATSLFLGFLAFPVVPNTVQITDGSQNISDNGFGALTGDGSGTISYSTGTVLVQFASPPANGTNITADYTYNVGSFAQASRSDTLKSRKQPKVNYDSTRDIFWVVWSESRSILDSSSDICFGLVSINYSYGDTSFPGYVELDGLNLAELASETPDSTTGLYSTIGPDIIRNGTVRTNRLIAASFAAFTETYEYEFFTNVNNLSVASDTTSPETFMMWEGERRKGVLTCTCEDVNESKVCDAGDAISASFATSNYDDGLVHAYGLFDKEVHNGVIYSKWLDNSNTSPGYYPSIAFDPISGRFLAAWEDNRDGSNTKVYGQLLYSGSGLYGQNFIISYQDTDFDGNQDPEVANSKQTRPIVSYDPVNQRFFIVWQDGRNDGLENLDIFGQKVDAEGTLRGENFAIFTKPFNQYAPSIAFNDITYEYLSVWKDARNSESSPGVPNNTCSSTGGSGTGAKPCGSDVYGQRFTLGQPALTLLNSDNSLLAPVILDDFENPEGSGSVTIGLFATQSFKIRSTGDSTLKIDCIDRTCGGIQPDPDGVGPLSPMSPFDFDGFDSSLQLCNDGQTLDLVPGEELPITVRFTPLAGGSYNKCFVIESDGGNPRVNVSATGIEADIKITPTLYDFGGVYIGSIGEKVFVVQNTGAAGLIISSFNSPTTPFTLQDGGCIGQMIAPGSTCTITARFTPTTTGLVNSTFDINSNDPDTPVLTVSLSGNGIGAQDITVIPLSVDFGNVQEGQSSQKTIQVRNDGTGILTINSIGNVAAPFSGSHNCPVAPATLGVGGACTITLQFSPVTSGTTSTSINILSNDPDEPNVSVNITGTGVITPDISVDPIFKNFDNTVIGATATQIFTVTNIGSANLSITGLVNPSGAFSISSSNCIGIIAPSASCTVNIEFTPTIAGFQQSSFGINSNDPDTPLFEVLLSGTGSSGQVVGGKISLSPAILDFLTLPVGQTATRIQTVTNIGSGNLTISSVSNPSSPFAISSNNCTGKTLSPAASCTIDVSFNPAYDAVYFPYYITISSSDPDNPTIKATLKGETGPLPTAKAGVFRNGFWYLDYNGNKLWEGCAVDKCYKFGTAGDQPVVGDWNNDGHKEIGVKRGNSWYLDYNGNGTYDGCGTTPTTDRCYTFGLAGDVPLAGDWNATGPDKIGVFRAGKWYLDRSGSGSWDGCTTDSCITFGLATDRPVAGDWSGTGPDKIGVFRSGTWYLDYSGNNSWSGCGTTPATDRCYTFGLAGDAPVTGDWNADGVAGIGTRTGNSWSIDANENGVLNSCTTDSCMTFGLPTDIPVAGNW